MHGKWTMMNDVDFEVVSVIVLHRTEEIHPLSRKIADEKVRPASAANGIK
jgi:hypothetical protein